jgi:hypothetical protein
VRELVPNELVRAFRAATKAFLNEANHADPALGQRLQSSLMQLTEIRPPIPAKIEPESLERPKT